MHAMMQVKVFLALEVRSVQKRTACGQKSSHGSFRVDFVLITRSSYGGNGGFAPSGRGHAMAPIEKLQLLLPKHFLLVIGSKKGSSKTSACHHDQVREISLSKQTTRCAMMQCRECKTVLSRDKNAAHVIADIFLEMKTSVDLPVWISNARIK